MPPRPVFLIILDGWGLSEETHGNAVRAASTPCFDALRERGPATTLTTHGTAVGLRPGLMGNSEVGHLNLGAGRVVWQNITRIDQAIEDGSFFEHPALRSALEVGIHGKVVHVMGLVSDGGVHSDMKHILALIEMASRLGLPPDSLHIHAITDGRDTGPRTGVRHLKRILDALQTTGVGRLATICGRYHAMDRDRRWARTLKAYALYTNSQGTAQEDPLAAIQAQYEAGTTDEFIEPIALPANRAHPIQNEDSVIFFNFRADRARQLTEAFTATVFEGFERGQQLDLHFVTMTRYRKDFDLPVCFDTPKLHNGIGEWLSLHDRRQVRIAETEKYAHVTYFFNGGREVPFPGEDRILAPSPKVATYDLQPTMSAGEVTRQLIETIERGEHDFFLLNFANPDMVGHTGNLEAATAAVEAVDGYLDKILEAVRTRGGAGIVTADHGNAETMIAPDGSPHTAHTTNPVPCVLVGGPPQAQLATGHALESIAPTLLDLLGLPRPEEMSGPGLLI